MTQQNKQKTGNAAPDACTSPPEQHTRMAVPRKSEPGLELDATGNPIPLEQRTQTDQARARAAHKP